MAVPPIVDASPARVAAHDRAGWLALFGPGAVVEDPIGAAQYRGAQLEGFYDTFIGPNRIRFDVERDAGRDGEVVRDVVIHTHLSTGVELGVPAFVYYRVAAERIERLAAYWEIRAMVGQVLRAGPRGLWTMAVLSVRMLRHLGVRGIWGFVRALTGGVSGRGRRAIERVADAFNDRDQEALARELAPGATVEWPTGVVPGELVVAKLVSAGWSTACRFDTAGGPGGVAVFSFAPGTARIDGVRFFVATTP